MLFVKYYNNVGALGRGMSALILACFFCSLVIALQMFDTLNSRIANPTERGSAEVCLGDVFIVGCTLHFASADSRQPLDRLPRPVGCTLHFASADSWLSLCCCYLLVGCTLHFASADSRPARGGVRRSVGCTLHFASADSSTIVMNCHSFSKVLPE